MKLVDPMGEMLTETWEGFATQLANTEQEELLTALNDIIEKEAIDMSQSANVFVGKDTRYRILTSKQAIAETTKGLNPSICCVFVGAAVPAFHKQCWMAFMPSVVTAKVGLI